MAFKDDLASDPAEVHILIYELRKRSAEHPLLSRAADALEYLEFDAMMICAETWGRKPRETVEERLAYMREQINHQRDGMKA